MKKNLLFALFFSLFISGLLLVGSTNAMTYTVNGSTQIAIPEDDSAGILIDWGNETATLLTICPSVRLDEIGQTVYQCSMNYEGEHTIKIDNPNHTRVETIYLSNSNIIGISNFNDFPNLKMIYLDNNLIEGINYNAFDGLNNNRFVTIYLRNNVINSFLTPITKITSLYLNNDIGYDGNKLTTIPTTIRSTRDDTTIKLSNTVSYGDLSKPHLVDLRNNPIKFVGLTGYKYNSYSDNHFERFGYDYENPDSPTYYYQILKNGVEVENTTGTTTDNEVEINTPLMPGDYTFKVCIYGDDVCDYNGENIYNFSVDYDDEEIIILKPEVNQTFHSLSFTGQRGRRGYYPRSLLTGYEYYLKKGTGDLLGGVVFLDSTNDCSFYDCLELDLGSEIESALGGVDPNDDYTLTVYLLDKDWNRILSATREFTINIVNAPATVDIISPGNEVSTQVVPFEWTYSFPQGSLYTFQYYEYTVKKGSDSIAYDNNTGGTYFELYDLDDGDYVFEVIVHYTDGYGNPKTATGTRIFQMEASEAPFVDIISPVSGSVITGGNELETNVSFSWNGGATLFNRYHYTLRDSSGVLTGGDITDVDDRQFDYDLGIGDYTFEVNMYKSGSNTPIASDSSYFSVRIPTTLDIISPVSGDNSSATILFSWEGFTPYTFSGYEYTVTGPNGFSTGGVTTDTSFSLQNLYDGSYTFMVTMMYKEGTTPKTITETRHFNINASEGANIQITSPNEPVYTGNYEKTVLVDFTWNGGGSPLISRYAYKLTNLTTNEILASGYVNENVGGNYSIPGAPFYLSGGTYRFEVTMLDNRDGSIIPPEPYDFRVVIPSHLNIIAPVQNANFNGGQNVSFSWSGFAEFDSRYHYERSLTKTKNGVSTTASGIFDMINMEATGFQRNLSNGVYDFTVRMMSGNTEIISDSRSFSILDSVDLQVYVSDGDTSVTTLESATGTFVWNGESEDLYGYYYSITGTTFKNILYVHTGKTYGASGSLTLNDLSSGKYRFLVNMLDSSNRVITGRYLDFTVEVPSSLIITYPENGGTVTSSNATFSWIGSSDILWTGYSNDDRYYQYELLQIVDSGYTQKMSSPRTNANSFSFSSLENGASYQLNVKLYSGSTLLARDVSAFTVSIPKKSSGGGGGGGSSSKSHSTNNLSVDITNDSPNTNERIEVKVGIDDKYTGKVDFTKMQYYTGGEWVDIPVTSKNYVSDYGDDAKLGYVRFSSSDDGEKELSEFVKLSQKGNYRIYVEDEDGYRDYVQFYVGKGGSNNTVKSTNTTTVISTPTDTEDEIFIARSCKKYKITYSSSLNVYTSPNLNMSEYFVNKDYFKRYIDSKNRYQDGCPTNVGWISTSYSDKTNDNTRYTAPNGKVYFITGKEGNYYSDELNKELKTPTSFSTVQQLKYYIRDRNPLINMATLGPVK